MKKTLQEMRADNFNDIVAVLALYRPGPMDFIPTYIARKHGREPVKYEFPECEDILKETYGVLVYQEQAMKMSVRLGGLTAGQSDYIRAGIGKKKLPLIEEWVGDMIYGNQEKGIPGALSKGYTEQQMLKLKEEWIKFGEYCFNKSHSVAYAKISLQTAWLKTYHPTEFMAALLTMSSGKKDNKSGDSKQIKYMEEAEMMGISILSADINESNADWTPNPENKTIRYGIASIAKMSEVDYNTIKEHRPFASFDDFLNANDLTMKINKTKCIALIKSGAFDSLNPNRNLLLRKYFEHRKEEFDHLPKTTTKKDIMTYEKEYFGVSLSVKSKWSQIEDGKEDVSVTGIVLSKEEWTAKSSGKKHWRAEIETREDIRPVIIWGYLVARNQGVLEVGNKVQLKGKKSKEQLTVSSMRLLEEEEK